MQVVKRKPRFSIVVPCYNEEAYIANTLKSLEKQDYRGGYEVIVVDNNCSDNTVTIARRLGARIVTEYNPGVCWARHSGTKAARGEIIISTDADTVFESNWLSKLDAEFIKTADLVALGGPCRYTNAPWWGDLYPRLLFGFIYILYKLTGYTLYMTATNIAFKKSAWTEYDTTLTQGGDEFDLLSKLRQKGRVRFARRPVVHTSARRLSSGLLYTFFVSFVYYYLAAYYLNKFFGRRIINSAPIYRKESLPRASYISLSITFVLIMLGIGMIGINQITYSYTSNVVDHIYNEVT